MVVPYDVADSAQDAVADRVIAWLESGGDVNDVDQDGFTLLNSVARGGTRSGRISPKHVTLLRHLIACGANVNIPDTGIGLDNGMLGKSTPSERAVHKYGGGHIEFIRVLLEAKANPNGQGGIEYSLSRPLCNAIHNCRPDDKSTFCVPLMLIRAGASLGAYHRNASVEDAMKRRELMDRDLIEHKDWHKVKALVAGVRKHGTYKKYTRAPHRDVLAVRGLTQRGKLRTEHRALEFLAMQGDNGVVWHILTYWRTTTLSPATASRLRN